MAGLAVTLDKIGESIVRLSNPTLDYDNRATKGLPFINFSEALPVALGYLVLCAYGYNKYINEKPKAPAATTKDVKEKKAWSWSGALAKLNSDNVYWLMFFYNIVQVSTNSFP